MDHWCICGVAEDGSMAFKVFITGKMGHIGLGLCYNLRGHMRLSYHHIKKALQKIIKD